MVRIHCLGGFREVGGNAVLIEASKNVMLDYGVKVETNTPPLSPKNVKTDALFVTHGHLDHLGMAPVLYKKNRCPVYLTDPVFDLSSLLLRDSIKVAKLKGMAQRYMPADVLSMQKSVKRLHHGDEINLGGVRVSIWDAGHMPGACMFVVKVKDKKILYTGDFKLESTRLVHGARFDVKDIDVVMMETTYSSRDHPPRKETEKELYREVKDTIGNGGIALLPSFAIRAPEMLMLLDHFGADFPIYLDGMAKDATSIFLKYPEFLRSPAELKSATERVIPLYSLEERNNAMKEPCAIVTTGGCLEGGPIIHYIKKLYAQPESSLILSGFQIPGTAGRYLVDTGRFVHGVMDLKLKMKLLQYDLSAHAGRTELIKFVQQLNPEKVICMHGDYCEKFATELNSRFNVQAIAPKNGDVIKI